MTDMSFKQAKEISERLELSELTLHTLLGNVEQATSNFEKTLKKQEIVLKNIPTLDRKLTNMKVLIGINIGFIAGLVVAKYFL